MAAIFAFTCSRCAQLHEGSPSFSFKAPDHYAALSDDDKAHMGELGSDLCTIRHEIQTDYFIRAVLEVPIHGLDEPFTWGIWVSLSKKSFERYVETYDSPTEGEGFFGWLCNSIPVYPEPASPRPSDVRPRQVGLRPLVFLHRENSANDQLVMDQYEGISVARAQSLAERALHDEA